MTHETFAHADGWRPFRTAALGLALGLVAAIVLLWAWNTVAAGLFGLATAQFRHALAAEAGIAAIAATVLALSRAFK
jgi:hypothetical protein